MNKIKPIDIKLNKKMEYHLKMMKILEQELRKCLMIPKSYL